MRNPRGPNPSPEIIARRREAVAKLHWRGVPSARRIAEVLAKSGLVNDKTGKPFSEDTVLLDIHWVVERDRREAAAEIAQHKGRILGELKEAARAAAAGEKGPRLRDWLRALEQQAKLLGADAPLKIEEVSNADLDAYLDAQVEARMGIPLGGEAAAARPDGVEPPGAPENGTLA
jgi:hypothetical protein